MRLPLLAFVVTTAGCELLYNPSNLKGKQDAAPDMALPDADPTMPVIDDVAPNLIFEGAGSGGSRPALVVIHGRNFVPDATVTLTPSAHLTITSTTVSLDNHWIAVTVEIDPDPTLGDGAATPLAVAVTQNGGTAQATDASAQHHVALQGLVDCSSCKPSDVGPSGLFSRVTGTLNLTGITGHVVVRATAGIAITGIDASASGQNPGPGGGRGGDAAGTGAGMTADGASCTVGAGQSPAAALLTGVGGGGAGFAAGGSAGLGGGGGAPGGIVGDKYIAQLLGNVGCGGGGGGNTLASSGGVGGGGGGTIELTAGGDVTVTGALTANGANGNKGNGGGCGGGGAGGLVLVRSGGTATLGTLSVSKGLGGTGCSNAGGDASDGRVRIDSAQGTQGPTYSGPMFTTAVPLTTIIASPVVMLRGSANDTPQGRVIDASQQAVLFPISFDATGTAMAVPPLSQGYNRVCATVIGGNPSDPESTNCIELAYLP